MARKLKDITQDPRWGGFIRRYRYNWALACDELFGLELTAQQNDIIADMQMPSCRVAISSGHGTGKSCVAGAAALIHIMTQENARVAIAAVKLETVKAGIWKYAGAHWDKLRRNRQHRWICQYFSFDQTKFYNKRQRGWAAVQKSGSAHQPEGYAGEHAEHLLYLVDECSGVPENCMQVISAALTEKPNRLVLISQPTRLEGYFFDAFHKLCCRIKEGISTPYRTVNSAGVFTCHILSCWESALVSREFIRSKILEYGGHTSAAFKIKVLGQFADENSLNLLSRDEVKYHQQRTLAGKVRIKKGWSWVALVDCAENRDANVCLVGRVSGQAWDKTQRFIPVKMIRIKGELSAISFARHINAEISEDKYPGITFNVDAQGIGAASADILMEQGRRVERIFWGIPCFSDNDKRNYRDRKAYGYISLRNGIREGRIGVHTDKAGEETIISEFSRVRAMINPAGKYEIESKKEMTGPSPDVSDAYAMLPLSKYSPPPKMLTGEGATQRANRLAMLDD